MLAQAPWLTARAVRRTALIGSLLSAASLSPACAGLPEVAPEATLLPSGGELDDQFGVAVALSADGSRALVGAPGDDTRFADDTGSARVFVRVGGAWSEEAVLVPADAIFNTFAGDAVALSADGTRALIESSDGALRPVRPTGRVFVRVGTTWSEEASLVPFLPGLNSGVRSVALSGDGTRAFLGGNEDISSVGAGGQGSVHVYAREGSSWTLEATLLAPDFAPTFGADIAVSGDGTRALVGAPGEPSSVYVFVRTGTSWSEEASLTSPDSDRAFGATITLAADGLRALVGGDGLPHGVVSYVREGSSWSEESAFPAWIAGELQLSADGTRAIGISGDTTTVFTRTSSGWSELMTLRAEFRAFRAALSYDGTRALVGGLPLEGGRVSVFTLPP